MENSHHRQFFDLSVEEKMSCIHKGGAGPIRGFNSSDQQKSSKLYPGNENIPDAKDAIVRRLHPSGNPLTSLLNELPGIAQYWAPLRHQVPEPVDRRKDFARLSRAR